MPLLTQYLSPLSPLSALQQAELANNLLELSDFIPATDRAAYPESRIEISLPAGTEKIRSPLANPGYVPIPLRLQINERFSSDGPSPNGRFQLLAKVGQGGMGVFYKVFDYKQQRVVGLKALLKSANETDVLRFDNEIKIGSQLDHDHLVSVYETIEFADGSRGMLMKFIEGEPLSRYLHRISYRQAVDILLDVASGVAHMHAKGILHRDLKPDNILIRKSDGRAFVTDFGIAKFLKDPELPATPSTGSSSPLSLDLTGAGNLIGTVGYFDPRRMKSDETRDLFALGAILYQLMSDGRQAFKSAAPGEGVVDIMKRMSSWLVAIERNQNPPWTIPAPSGNATRDPDYVGAEIQRIIFRCFRGDAPHRFRSAAAFMTDLLKVKAARLKREIGAIEKSLENAMQLELPVFLERTGVTIDPALNPAEMTEEELANLLHSPVRRKDGKVFVTAATRDLLSPAACEALDDLDARLGRKIDQWRTEISLLANRILAKRWPVTALIAETHYEFLEHREFALTRDEIRAFADTVRTYEAPVGPAKDRPKTRALTQALPLRFEDPRDYVEGGYVTTPTKTALYEVASILNSDGEETGQYRRGEEREILNASLGLGEILVLDLENDGYAPVSIPIQVPLKKRRELIEAGSQIVIVPELIGKKHVPKGFTVIPGNTSVVGLPYGRNDPGYSIPQMDFTYGPFAAKVATLGDYYRYISRLVREGRFDEAEKRSPRGYDKDRKLKSFFAIRRETREVEFEDMDPSEMWITASQACRGVSPEDLFRFASEEGYEAGDMFRWEIAATGGVQGFTAGFGAAKANRIAGCFNGYANWGKAPQDIQVPEMDEIPPGVPFNENGSLINGLIGFFGSLFATPTPGTIGNIVVKGVAFSATRDAIGFNARKQQIRPRRALFADVSSYTALLIKKFERKKP